ncbi:MAG: FG-GAP-like repeat-containing protein [Gemmatimonadota bacterium]
MNGRQALAGIALLLVLMLTGCKQLPRQGSTEYDEAVAAFYTGVAAIQVGEDERAERALSRVAELAPDEPAAIANLAIIAFQQRRLDDAARLVERARGKASDNASILMLAALVERARNRLDPAIDHLRRAPDPRARFLLGQMLEQRAVSNDVAESRRLLDTMLAVDSANLFLLVATARHAARHADRAALERALVRLAGHAAGWPESFRTQLERVRAAAGPLSDAGTELTVLAASLESLPAYARERDALTISEQQPDIVLTEFLRLRTPSPRPPAPDLELRYETRRVEAASGDWLEAQPIWLGSAASARVALLGPRALWLAADSSAAQNIAVPNAASAESLVDMAALDFNHDFRIDLALVGGGGVRILRQEAGGGFVDIDPASIPRPARTRAYTGAWAADTDLDGDVDLVVSPRGAPPLVLRNLGDGTFAEQQPFDDRIVDASDFVWGDLDDDGDPDAVFLDAGGRLHMFANPRQDQPRFVRRSVPNATGSAHAIALGDPNADGKFDLMVLHGAGVVTRAWLTADAWQMQEIARWQEFTPDPAGARLFIADLDNNAALDVIASAAGRSHVWLGDSAYALVSHQTLPVTVTAVADLTGGGRVELLGIDSRGQAVRLSGRFTRDYYGLTVAPRATAQPGDRRINTFGIGGVVEVRAGLLYQKQPIGTPFVHLGIGESTGVNVARIVWPNGTAQAEFDLLASQGKPIIADQRLKGSCPWLFAFDGNAMRFVTDVIWRTAAGLRINTYGATTIIHSEDWIKIRSDQLAAQAGDYTLSITGELWESHFFDQLALMTVDHPVGTEVFVDERFILPPPELKVHATERLRAVAGAWDDQGREVTSLVGARDQRYVDSFELGEFQGAAREHFLEVDLGADAPADAPLLLIANGWIYPTDGSINFAMGQGRHPPLQGIRAEVPDGRGGWTVLHSDLGMPSGKTKTVLIDLTGAFRANSPRRVRLRTNMEIYWDHITWTEARPQTELKVTRVPPREAELRYRGFSRSRQAGRKAPDLPDYVVAGTAQRWPDLEGFYTRFGDVRPLLQVVDDRYVIMNAGDELSLAFPAQPAPPTGWVRDFVLIADGWVKDGDYNDGFSKTLLPLPYHGMTDYSTPPGALQDDPVYRRHPNDWREYHTRYVNPTRFQRALSRD